MRLSACAVAHVPPLIADWIREQAHLKETSVSVVVREPLAAYLRRLAALGLIVTASKGGEDDS